MKKPQGYSLAELMITVAIIATLATVATQSYRSNQLTIQRKEAVTALFSAASSLDPCVALRNSFLEKDGCKPAKAINSNLLSERGNFKIEFNAATLSAEFYELRAVPTKIAKSDSICGIFMLNAQREKSMQKNGPVTGTVKQCW